jgi:2-polyprenyl-3-methyl-5-hydroxy-6-metoxy-1,4-benzoquinol methylase
VSAPDVDAVLQRARLELYRDNVAGALGVLEEGLASTGDARLADEAAKVRAGLGHLATAETYARAYEHYYQTHRAARGLKGLERRVRTWLGRRTRNIVARCARDPEYLLLEREILATKPRAVFDAGCGEGRIALTVASRHSQIRVEAVDVSATNVQIARRLNRYPNVTFHLGLLEQSSRMLPAGTFDLAYSFAVLEHVRDLDEAVGAMLAMLRPGGRFCFSVPMNHFAAAGALPPPSPSDDGFGHVRAFTEPSLRARFGSYPAFALEKVPGEWNAARYPDALRAVEYGAYFVAFSTPSRA